METRLVLLLVALVVACARPTSGYYTTSSYYNPPPPPPPVGASTGFVPMSCSAYDQCNVATSPDCAGSSDSCCNGFCQAAKDLPRVMPGGTCSISNCDGLCLIGDCRNRRCVKDKLPLGCACSVSDSVNCASGLFCNSSATAGVPSVCTLSSSTVIVGGSCALDSQCYSGSCVNGLCAAASFVSCPNYQLPCAQPGQKCVDNPTNGVSSWSCSASLSDNSFCGSDYDCLSGGCNATVSSRAICVEQFGGVAGQPCTSWKMCQSHYCNSTGRCSDPQKVHNQGAGAACLDGDINCAPGLRCMGVNAPICVNVVGADCSDTSGDICGRYVENPFAQPVVEEARTAAFTQVQCLCGAGKIRKCAAATPLTTACDVQFIAADSFFRLSFSSSPFYVSNDGFADLFDRNWAVFPAIARQKMAAYMCCALGPKGSHSAGPILNSDIGQGMGYYLDCSLSTPDMLPLDEETREVQCNVQQSLAFRDVFKGDVRF